MAEPLSLWRTQGDHVGPLDINTQNHVALAHGGALLRPKRDVT